MGMKHCAAVAIVLVLFAVICLSDGQQVCKRGSECFPRGVPDGLSANDSAYYCCPEKNTTRSSHQTTDGTWNCTCVPDFTLEGKIQKWADDTKDEGRMCNRGEEACAGSRSKSTMNYRFVNCCWSTGFTTTTIFDGDKEEYIVCRCGGSPIPSPDPTAYVVPQTAMYNSTGEVCSYNEGCDDHPSSVCNHTGAIFCCYGSRGMVTENDGNTLTRCTCTNQVFGERCESAPVPIAQTTQHGQQVCKRGSECFPGGVPDGLSANDSAYYCCPEKNTTRSSNHTTDGTWNCTCVPDFTLEGKIQKWADDTKDEGRMCNRGEEACAGSRSKSTTNYRFVDCCWSTGFTNTTTTIFDGDKEEYIGCRCGGSPIPSPDPTAYIVPQTAMYNSTGEVCSYNEGCDDHPSSVCNHTGAIFCCYGSRGMVTENDGNTLTRCTCTNQVFGERCESAPVPIAQTTQHGQQVCKRGSECFPGGVPDGLSANDSAYYCCPEKNTTWSSNQTADGTWNCTCVPDFTLEGKIQKWADDTKDEGRMCNRGEEACAGSRSKGTTNYRFVDCCWSTGFTNTTTTIFDGDKEEYIGCRCTASLIPSPDPTAYIVPQTAMYNSTGEVCSYNEGCDDHPSSVCNHTGAIFCCYGSRGMVTENDGNTLTRCTCTNQVFGERCESAPVPIALTTQPCLSECTGKVDDDVCKDDQGNERCCAHNMAVKVTLHNGNITDCTCTTAKDKSCVTSSAPTTEKDTSSAPTFRLQSAAQLLVLVLSAALLGHRSLIC